MNKIDHNILLVIVLAVIACFAASSWLQSCKSDEYYSDRKMLSDSIARVGVAIELQDSLIAQIGIRDSVVVDSLIKIRPKVAYYRDKLDRPEVVAFTEERAAKLYLIEKFSK